MNWC